eukprot:3067831-Rhodomonas_salina.1
MQTCTHAYIQRHSGTNRRYRPTLPVHTLLSARYGRYRHENSIFFAVLSAGAVHSPVPSAGAVHFLRYSARMQSAFRGTKRGHAVAGSRGRRCSTAPRAPRKCSGTDTRQALLRGSS